MGDWEFTVGSTHFTSKYCTLIKTTMRDEYKFQLIKVTSVFPEKFISTMIQTFLAGFIARKSFVLSQKAMSMCDWTHNE